MNTVFLGLGSNLGNRVKTLEAAKKGIEESIGSVILLSSLYETEPWGFESQRKFLNMILSVRTALSPSGVLGRLLMIESKLGRLRSGAGYASRSIDIDILLYGDIIVDEVALKIPHPEMHVRRFVLVPLAEIAPDTVHPLLKKTTLDLLKTCKDTSEVRLFRKTSK